MTQLWVLTTMTISITAQTWRTSGVSSRCFVVSFYELRFRDLFFADLEQERSDVFAGFQLWRLAAMTMTAQTWGTSGVFPLFRSTSCAFVISFSRIWNRNVQASSLVSAWALKTGCVTVCESDCEDANGTGTMPLLVSFFFRLTIK